MDDLDFREIDIETADRLFDGSEAHLLPDISQRLVEEANLHSGEVSELLEGAASEIDLLRDEKSDLRAALTTAREENERLTAELMAYRLDEGPKLPRKLSRHETVVAGLKEKLALAEAENATLRAAVAGKTFFHSDEEVNAEMGRLRAKVEELSARPLDQIIRAVMAHGYSCEEAADILSDYLHRREKIRQANALKESQ